jgi:hypothetical protein
LLEGTDQLAPESWGRNAWPLSVVSATAVAEGARWLRDVAPGAVGSWEAEDFVPWRQAYLEAAALGEVIVIGCG